MLHILHDCTCPFDKPSSPQLTNCIWEETPPPAFMSEWEEELSKHSPEKILVRPSDDLSNICFQFAVLRSDMLHKRIPDSAATERAAKIEADMIQWSIDTMTKSPGWRYQAIEVRDSPHVWNGVVHALSSSIVASVWNLYRSIRIMLTRTQELLCRRMGLGGVEEERQTAYFRNVRRQMTDDICAGIATQLGHAAPAYNSQCVIVTAYGSIWPIFFATTCALERIGFQVWNQLLRGRKRTIAPTGSAAYAQAAWLLSRLEYISKELGIKWADGVAATLRGDFYHVPVEHPMPSTLR